MASTKKSRELAKALRQVPYDVGMEHGIKIGRAEGFAEGLAEAKAKAKAEGAEEVKLSVAKRLISMGIDNEAIHQGTELPMETIEEIRKQVK